MTPARTRAEAELHRWASGAGSLTDIVTAAIQSAVDEARAEERERLLALLPKCWGEWLSGSGGHARFDFACDKPAAWVDSHGGDWLFCDAHAPEHLKNRGGLGGIESAPWGALLSLPPVEPEGGGK